MRFLLLIFITFSFIGCGSIGKRDPKRASVEGIKLYEDSKKDVRSGKEKFATDKLSRIIKTEPDSDIADDAAISLGNLYFKVQNYERAYDSYMLVVKSNVFSPKEVEALYLAGKSLYFLDRFDAAASLLEKSLQISPIEDQWKLKIHELRYQVKLQQGDYVDSLESLIFLSQKHPSDEKRSYFQSRAKDLVDSKLNDQELDYVSGRRRFENFRGYALFRMAEESVIRRDFNRATRYYEGVVELLPNTEQSDRANQFLKRMRARKTVDAKTIGVVLPLTGRHSKIAYKALRGIQLALGIYGPNPSDYKLAIVDSEGNADIAQRAVERLVLEDNVVAIIGSLLSRTARSVSETAHQFGVPSIALSQKSGITAIGESVFRNSLTSEMQVAHLVQTAMEGYGLKRFAILYPNDAYGVEYANIFWDHVLANGGQITGIQPYKPNETDFKGPVRRLVGTFYTEGRLEEYKHFLKEWQKENLRNVRRQPPDDLLAPIVDFDAIFIPDNTKALGQIAPMLRFNDVSNVYLMGTNLWNTKSVIRRSQDMAENLLFIDSVLAYDEEFQSSLFYQTYQQTFGEGPRHFEIQAYDAARLLRSVLDTGVTNRISLIEKLKTVKNYPGATGLLTMSERREISQPVFPLTVREQSIKKAYTIRKE